MTSSIRVREDGVRPVTLQVLDYLTDADELPHTVPDKPLWSENYLDQAYDPDCGVGIYMHLSRAPFNPRVWLENFTVYLPEGQLLVYRGYGPNPAPNGPGGACLTWDCVKPYVEWRKRFDGGVRMVSTAELMRGPLADGAHIGAQMDLTLRSSSHVFDLGDVSVQDWAHFHYEQHFDAEGTITYGDRRIEFKGTGLRDHSVGSRDMSGMGKHCWHSGQFPDTGRGFSFSDIHWRDADRTLRLGVITDADGVHRATIENSPCITDDSQVWDPYEMVMTTGDGRRHVIKAEVLQVMPHSLLGVNEIGYGNNTGPEASHLLLDCQGRYDWDGDIGYGLVERSVARPLQQNLAATILRGR